MMGPAILETTKEHRLANGLKVICCRKSTTPIIAVQVWYTTGSAYEREGIRGISHVLEHMMFRGSQHVASEEHARRINDVGGHCNAFTAEDVCAYINSVPREYLDMVLDLEADRMAGLELNLDILETERNVIVEEYHTYMNNPVAKAFLEFRRSFYGPHPYAISPLGNLNDINAISADHCRNYFAQHYFPANAVVVVVGDFENEQTVFDMVERRFGHLTSPKLPHTLPEVAPIPPKEGGEAWMKRVVEFDVPMLIIGFPGPASSSSDALLLDILQMIVSQGESSRMHREVVRRKSVAVMSGGMNHFLRLSGMSLFFAAFTPDNSPRRVLDAIEAEIALVRTSGVTPLELEKMRNTMLTNRAFEMYSAEHICNRLGYAETVEGDYHLWIERIKELERLDRDALTQAARTYWNEHLRYALYLKPRKIRPLLYAMGLGRRILGMK